MVHLVTEFHIKIEMISYQHELKRDISAIIKGKNYLQYLNSDLLDIFIISKIRFEQVNPESFLILRVRCSDQLGKKVKFLPGKFSGRPGLGCQPGGRICNGLSSIFPG